MHPGARELPAQHLPIRVPWHDTGWSGTVCRAPEKNGSCIILKRIREDRDLAHESLRVGQDWLHEEDIHRPACAGERGAALNERAYVITLRHPFALTSRS